MRATKELRKQCSQLALQILKDSIFTGVEIRNVEHVIVGTNSKCVSNLFKRIRNNSVTVVYQILLFWFGSDLSKAIPTENLMGSMPVPKVVTLYAHKSNRLLLSKTARLRQVAPEGWRTQQGMNEKSR